MQFYQDLVCGNNLPLNDRCFKIHSALMISQYYQLYVQKSLMLSQDNQAFFQKLCLYNLFSTFTRRNEPSVPFYENG